MRIDDFDLAGFDIQKWALDDLNAAQSLEAQASFLVEDLALVVRGDRLVDVGFYGDDAKGEFRVSVIENEDWESPVLFASTLEIGALPELVRAALLCAKRSASKE